VEVGPPECHREKTHPIENLPVDLSKSMGKFAKMASADFVSIRIGYEDSN
jgi:hypothetical protein